MAKKRVFFFGNGKADGNRTLRNLLGGKGADLAEMTNLGIPVPAGFTITTEVCIEYYKNKRRYPEGLREEVERNMAKVEKAMGRKYQDVNNPLLVSVRSGARVSMPGMMDTVLNIGLNETTLQGLVRQTGNERFGYDSYRRFVQMYGHVVMGVEDDVFEHLIDQKKKEKGVTLDIDLGADDWKDLSHKFKDAIYEKTGQPFPEEPQKQLWGAIGAVFESWENKRARKYRELHGIPHDWGTAVNVQAMVFGNMGDDCATGVAFTRDPATGERVFYGEFLPNAQGEDVVAGIRTPQPINKARKTDPNMISLEEYMPRVYKELVQIYRKLEKHFTEMQDIEFTIERGKLWMLQTRTGKRTVTAAIKIASDMVKEGLIDKRTALLRIPTGQLDQLLHPTFDPKAEREVIARGLPASPGAATGKIVFSAERAEELSGLGEKVILVRIETSPEDIGGMAVAQGILTQRGGMTSHAAVVARGMGKCCVAGCGNININYANSSFSVNSRVFNEGDSISLDGTTGEVMVGEVRTVIPTLGGDFGTVMKWADQTRHLKVRTNADTPHDAAVARRFGAEGIGLCRTEHMFFEGDRVMAVREMILASDKPGREKALTKLLPMQKGDFIGIFKEMEGLPVTIRLLDPPLHEFLPHETEQIEALAQDMGVSVDKLREKVESLKEFNPMLGHRGCRLGITYPEIYRMQTRAIIEAACELAKQKIKVIPEIMIPLVGDVNEIRILKQDVLDVAKQVMKEQGIKVKFTVGTMIEVPRGAITADRIAEEAEFFSFGTNDLTQMAYGFSRDDSVKFLQDYLDKGIFDKDPFQVLDQVGVGELMKMAVERGRSVRGDLKLGICGEHGGEPSSVEFCHRIGLDYVSCSPYRVPIARLAAAQAVMRDSQPAKARQAPKQKKTAKKRTAAAARKRASAASKKRRK
ncbi:MAG: pyruvate, phosphate dikinase [Candidatus Abyssobacteria bacterium SURF_5]|uniref:Pyruvate, phosphate dikinase n=1 Tax=Abyssobacteria bacterium (strain SURF_5) TaxID=2093360 RepID=A0A3A4NFL0_ABYX5|nr:MAG: pyruvate, phosphate dikinase [Candidatus Abyssubacteria bacterium SURF_5]